MSRPATGSLRLTVNYFPLRLNDSTTPLKHGLQATMSTPSGSGRFTGPEGRRLFAICAGGCIAALWVMDKIINKERQREAKRTMHMNKEYIGAEDPTILHNRDTAEIAHRVRDAQPTNARKARNLDLHDDTRTRASAHRW
ncbi:hypothetical protein FA13DRAFT_71880 [Coprinellus micaceus]|uniref:Uncharacterized protein n=1 Tax=Coprinellus micaceus TaxID=71717 RepID=A0A4Y7TJ26_COPMI|nr:hypothetical protein FA13DRAFT_71880 [Coprinellus micaceus]